MFLISPLTFEWWSQQLIFLWLKILTWNRTGEVPLSCSGTPAGTWCLCLSFFFHSFFFSLRFGLLRVFFRPGGGVRDTLGSWMKAVVGQAMWFCSEDTLRKDRKEKVLSVKMPSVIRYR